MDLAYKKMFEIKYNNKTFAIFLGKNNQRIIMEVVDGKYVNPLKDDFFALNEIYNNKDRSILAKKKPLTFKEAVFTFSLGALSMLVLPPAIECVDIAFQEVCFLASLDDDTRISDIETLEKYFDLDAVTFHEVIKAINSNANLQSKYKTMMEKFATYMNFFQPDFDLRIFAENAKDIEFVVTSSEKIKNHAGKNVAAYYSIKENKIYITNNSTDETIYHEIAHTAHCLHAIRNNNNYYRSAKTGDALDEAMNVLVTKNIAPEESAYFNERMFLDYFNKCTGFNLENYNKYGINRLIEMLEDKYPKVDINYIVTCLDSLNDSSIQGIELEENSYADVVAETFKICLNNMSKDMEDIYAPLRDFLGVCRVFGNFDTYYGIYLEKYNIELEKLGYKDIISYEDILRKIVNYESVNTVAINEEGEVRLLNLIDLEATDALSEEDIPIEEYEDFRLQTEIKNSFLKIMALSAKKIDDDFWLDLIETFDLARYQDYHKVDLTFNGQVLENCFINDCKLFLTENQQGELGFLLENKTGEVIYQSDEKAVRALVYIEPSDYFYASSVKEIKLDKYLSDEYLTMYVKYNRTYKLAIIDNKVVFDNNPDKYKSLDRDFWASISSIRYAHDDYYEPLKRFIKANKEDFLFSGTLIYLDKYNEALKKLGINDIITPQDIESKIGKYIGIVGFLPSLGEVKPVIFEDDIYKVVESDGTKKEINAEDIVWSSVNTYKAMINTAILYEDILDTPEYWMQLVQDYSLMAKAYFEEIDIYRSDKFLGKSYIKDIKIFLGVNEVGDYGFILKDKERIVYSELDNYSKIRDLGKLVDFGINDEAVNLDRMLEVLKSVRFSDISFTEQGVIIDPAYYITINYNQEICTGYLRDMYFTCYDDCVLTLQPFNLTTKIDRYFWGSISLKSVLNYAGILNEEQMQYYFNFEEIETLIMSYMNDNQISRN